VNRVVRAAAVAGALSGVPSTAWALARHGDPLAPTWAAGRLLAPGTPPGPRLLGAATVVHGAVSLGWTAVLAAVLPHRRRVATGAAGGVAIAALDLGVARLCRRDPRFAAVARLPLGPQVADHVAFGVIAAATLR
jgi:hypothetical protein